MPIDVTEAKVQQGRTIAFRASANLHAALETVAAAEGLSVSDVVRRAALFDVTRMGFDIEDDA